MPVVIREAITPQDREEVYRFRYRVYVEEMRRTQEYADHEFRRIEEPLDQHGHILAAFDGDRVVGTVRYNLVSGSPFHGYESLYRLPSFGPFFPERVSITTKLMIGIGYRKTSLALRLASECYRCGLRYGSMFDFIDCNSPLRDFFAKLGYRQVDPMIEHPEYGTVIPMILVLRDCNHLASVRSPFLQDALRVGPDQESIAFFQSNLTYFATTSLQIKQAKHYTKR